MFRLNRVAGLTIIAALVAAVLFLRLPGTHAWQRVLEDSAHGPVFAVIAAVLLLMSAPAATPRGTGRSPRVYVRAFWTAVLIGAATEIIQRFEPGRDASLLDLFHDACGAALALCVLGAVERVAPRRALIAIALAGFVAIAWAPLRMAQAYANRAVSFPVIASGTRAVDLYFLRARNATLDRAPLPSRWSKPGEIEALRLSFRGGRIPAFELVEPAPDWRGRSVLGLDATNPNPEALVCVLRILDRLHDWSSADRLNLQVVLPAETRSTVRVALSAVAEAPLHRRMDMAGIANVMLYCRGPAQDGELYVSRLWLE